MTQQTPSTTALLQPHVTNQLAPSADKHSMVAGIIGEQPSLYAKSPLIWNAAFTDLQMDAVYLPFDVSADHLPALVGALRSCSQFVGGNVTIPHKLAIMDLLDRIDPIARQIGAVNTIRRTEDGKLIGYNTDVSGAMGSLLKSVPWQPQPLMETLEDKRTLLIGAGGAGRAMAFGVAQHYGVRGELYIANRSFRHAQDLANAVKATYAHAQAIDEASIGNVLSKVDLVINSSTKGQSGLRHLPDGRVTCLELYSSLAPANPAVMDPSAYEDEKALLQAWEDESAEDIKRNLAASAEAIRQAEQNTAFFDMVYSPLETPLLAQARQSGHATLNGKGMNILQAVDGFVTTVVPEYFARLGWSEEHAFQEVTRSMAAVW